MRIAFVSIMGGSPWAASELLWADTAERALSEGHNVFVSHYRWSAEPVRVRELQRAGATIDLRSRAKAIRRSALLARLSGSFAELRRFGPDVVCVNQGGTYDIARSGNIAELRRVIGSLAKPYVLLSHCEQAAPAHRNIAAARRMFESAAVAGLLGTRARTLVKQHLGIELQRARVFQNPVNLRQTEKLDWPPDPTLRMAFVGRLEPVKNLAALLGVLAAEAWRERNWSLTIHGDGSQRAVLEKLTRACALTEHVCFTGHVNDISGVWRHHHILVLPSLFEGVPLAMIEAMLCGRPAMATDTGGVSDWLEDGAMGFLIPDASALTIASALDRMWAHRSRLAEMGNAAYTRTLAHRDADPAGTLLAWLVEAGTQDQSVR